MKRKGIIGYFRYFYLMLRHDIRTKSVIFIIGILLWLNINLENEFETTLKVPIRISNIMQGRTLLTPIPSEAKIKIKSKGKSLIALNPEKNLYFDIDVSGVKDSALVRLNSDLLNNTTSTEVELLYIFYPQELEITLDSLVTKKIPISLRADFTLAPGYVTSGKFNHIPDSVTAKGPFKKINRIKQIYTEARIDTNLKADYVAEIPLILPDKDVISYSADKVSLMQKIVRKGINKFKVPIQLVNVPQDANIMIDPIAVEIEISGPVNELQNISADNFKAVADWERLRTKDNTILININSDIKLPWKALEKEVTVIEL